MPVNKYVKEVISSLPRNEPFSIHQAYELVLKTFPKYTITRARLSQAINRTGCFDTWKDGRTTMFKYRGPKA